MKNCSGGVIEEVSFGVLYLIFLCLNAGKQPEKQLRTAAVFFFFLNLPTLEAAHPL